MRAKDASVAAPLIGDDDEVRDITGDDLKAAQRGRPALPPNKRKRRVNLMLDPEVIEGLKAEGNMSASVNNILREKLGL
ncbi:hypothetical protein JI58_01260 [Marinosulfonomonas sp. PRT-SC04]|nr:hypothetical protein JI58_01260 [Marinosulfonomonas sp. PRT-SC04]